MRKFFRRKNRNTKRSAPFNYGQLEDRRVLAAIGSFDAGTNTLTVNLTGDSEVATISTIGSEISLNGSTDLDPSTGGVQSVGISSVQNMTFIGDGSFEQTVNLNNRLDASGNATNFSINNLAATGVTSVIVNGQYDLSGNMDVSLVGSTGKLSDLTDGRVSVAGTTTFDGGANGFFLNNLDNDFVGDVSIDSTTWAYISDANDLQFSQLNVGIDTRIQADGQITDAPGTQIEVGRTGYFTTTGNVILGDDASDTTNFFRVAFQAADVELNEDSDVILISSNVDNLTVNTQFAITDGFTTTITVTERAVFNAGVNGGNGLIRIGDNGRDTFTAGLLTFQSGGGVHITENDSMMLFGNNRAASTHLISAGDLENAESATINIQNILGLESLTEINLGNQPLDSLNMSAVYFYAPGDVSLNAESNIHMIYVNNEAANMTLQTPSAITDDAGAELRVSGNARFEAASVNVGDTIPSPSGDTPVDKFFAGSVSFQTTGLFKISEDDGTIINGEGNTAGSATINSAGLLTNADDTTMSVGGDVILIGQNINVGEQAGDNFEFGQLLFVTPGVATITENGDTFLVGNNSAAVLNLSADGLIADGAATTTISGNAKLTASSITLGDLPATDPTGGTVQDAFTSGSLTVVADTATGPNNVIIEQDGAINLFGENKANVLDLTASGNIFDSPTAKVEVRFLDLTGAIINLGTGMDPVTGQPDLLTTETLTFNSTGNTFISADSSLHLVGANSSAADLILISTGDITDNDDDATEVRVANNATINGDNVTLGEEPDDCFIVGAGLSVTSESGTVINDCA